MIFEETHTLPNGVKIPKLGLGTWSIPDDTAADLGHMRDNVQADSAISAADMDVLWQTERIRDHGEFSIFPACGGKM